MSIGKRIYEARKQCNITQEQLAEQLGVTRQSISRWESDVVYPDMENIVKLADILKVSCDYLLRNEISNDIKEKGVSRLFLEMIGKVVSIEFYDDDDNIDVDKATILSVDDGWVKLQEYKTDSSLFVKLSSIKAIKMEG